MSLDYAGATINGVNSLRNGKPVQDMIGIAAPPGALTPPLTQMQNGHIGGALTAAAVVPAARAVQIALNLTPCLNTIGGVWTWKTATGLWSV